MNKKQTYLILGIIALGTFGIAQAASTVITDTSITTTNLTVTGTCTGCGGGGEATYTNWNTNVVNFTIGSPEPPGNMYIDNNGNFMIIDSNGIARTYDNAGTLQATASGAINSNARFLFASGQSETGKYQIYYDGTNYVVNISSGGNALTTYPLKIAAGGFFNPSTAAVAISPNGKFILIDGGDWATQERVLVQQGS